MNINSNECKKALYDYETKNYGEHMAIELLLSKGSNKPSDSLFNCIMSDYEFDMVTIIARDIVIKLGIELK